ncbi:hypothetical protein BD414DRAFT_560998 [Trametes punicea]|nr:hypothetical protein BD414DRAFT_560998 [Trametes punicea]
MAEAPLPADSQAGLFSAVRTAFNIELYILLHLDHEDEMLAALMTFSAQLHGVHTYNNTHLLNTAPGVVGSSRHCQVLAFTPPTHTI